MRADGAQKIKQNSTLTATSTFTHGPTSGGEAERREACSTTGASGIATRQAGTVRRASASSAGPMKPTRHPKPETSAPETASGAMTDAVLARAVASPTAAVGACG